METLDVAVIGTGLMGAPMAANIARAGFRTQVWNRSAEKAAPLASQGCIVANTAVEAISGAQVVISMLDSAAATDAVFVSGGLLQQLAPGSVWVVMSSLSPQESREHAVLAAARGLAYIDAPVSGGPEGARQGTLAIMAGGDEAHFECVLPVLRAMGRPTRVGPVGCGQLAKLANQAIVADTITAVAEALMLAERGGADPAKVREALAGGFADSKILQLHGLRMITRDFAKRGTVKNQLKDLNNIIAEAERVGLTLPVSSRVREMYQQLMADGHAGLDHSAAWVELERLNPPPNKGAPEK